MWEKSAPQANNRLQRGSLRVSGEPELYSKDFDQLGSKQLAILLLIRSINEINNPDFISNPSDDSAARFMRLADLVTDLSLTGRLDYGITSQEGGQYSIEIRNYAPERLEEVRELMSLLDLPMSEDTSKSIILPILLATEAPETPAVALTTRSIYDLTSIMSAAIDMPEKHVRSGLAINYPPSGLSGQKIRFYRSDARPSNAFVAVKYRESWFYIDETDQDTKLAFRILRILYNERMASSGDTMAAPVFTIPVTR
jgi:hypothetical protein